MPIGTRTKSGSSNNPPAGGANTRSSNRDLGASKSVTSTLTFAASGATVTGSTNDFASFVAGDTIHNQGGTLNNGADFKVIGIDAVNHAYLTLAPAPKDEGPITATIRVP